MDGVRWGGSEELWSQTAIRLHQAGHEIMASVAWWPDFSPKVTALMQCGIKLFVQPPPHHAWPIRVWQKFTRRLGVNSSKFEWLRLQKPDLVVISQGGIADGVECMNFCATVGLPYVAIVQCNMEGWYPNDEKCVAMAKAYLAAKKIFCVSQHNLKLLEYQLGEKLPQASVVWNPYNVVSTPPPAWPSVDGIWKLACVARLEPAAKGQDLLFQVLAQKHWQELPIEINLYGSGPCARNLQKLAGSLQLSNVHFRGHVADVNEIWKENHLLVLPSRFEGLPLALVEAMWCARPALVTDIGGNAEMCVDGETGFVAPAPAFGLLAQTLTQAWQRRDDWQAMGKTARARAERLVPVDPIGVFCKQLMELVPPNHA